MTTAHLDPWLPIGFALPGGISGKQPLCEGSNWQIIANSSGGKTLLVVRAALDRWLGSNLVPDGTFASLSFGSRPLYALHSGPSHCLAPVFDAPSPNSKSEAMAFAAALAASRAALTGVGLQDAIYVEKLSRLLPTYSISTPADDADVLGYWLTGGAHVSARSSRRLAQLLSWLPPSDLADIVQTAGVAAESDPVETGAAAEESRELPVHRDRRLGDARPLARPLTEFRLPGRPDLEAFFREHVIDIVVNREQYRALGIESPGGMVLHGPPGCGKTFAVERLVEFLGWPEFHIEASSVASPYIHETSRKVAALFEAAVDSAPSVLIIDEMEAFLATRDAMAGQHRVEEIGEFLRRIPEASRRGVLVIAMTNRLDMIDAAVLRRGRFDHIVEVKPASAAEVLFLLRELLSALPSDVGVDPLPLADRLAERPLSDVAFVVREGARLAARDGRSVIQQADLERALSTAPSRGDPPQRRIGFV